MARIDRIELTNFRSYQQALVKFGERTLVVGQNAAGKTNLLEAVSVLTTSKSFRADRERELLRWGAESARLAAAITTDQPQLLALELGVGSRGVQKRYAVDKQKTTAVAATALVPTVLFSADDVRLVDGAPGRRRRALDLAISGLDARYQEALRRYGRVLAGRNRLLEQVAAGEAAADELDFWDQQLVESGQVVVNGRQTFVEGLNRGLNEYYQALAFTKSTNTTDQLEIAYQPLLREMRSELANRRRQDLAIGTTSAGPHRDDWSLLLGRRPLSSFGSGGEYRSALLAFRLAETELLTERRGSAPVVLLDDVFSELDAFRREALIVSLPETQTIITTPETAVVPTELLPGLQVLHISGATDGSRLA